MSQLKKHIQIFWQGLIDSSENENADEAIKNYQRMFCFLSDFSGSPSSSLITLV